MKNTCLFGWRKAIVACVAGLGLCSVASATSFPEVEANGTKATANAFTMASGDTITGATAATTDLDYFKVTTAAAAPGIYQYDMILTTSTGTVTHTMTLRGLNFTGFVACTTAGTAGTTDSTAQTASTPVTGQRLCRWYGFGGGESMYVRVVASAANAVTYTLTLTRTTITPTAISGTFIPGPATVTTIGQGHTTDTDIFMLDPTFSEVGLNDDNCANAGGDGTTLQSRLTRTVAGGTYYLGISAYDTHTLVPPVDERDTGGIIQDFPSASLIAACTSSTTTAQNCAFALTAGAGTTSVPAASATRTLPFQILFYSFSVSNTPTGSCTQADGTCAISTQASCTGTYGGDTTTCPATGRCCGAACVIRNPANCTFVGGTYGGDGTTCANCACGAPSNDLCSGAIAVSVPSSTLGTTVCATSEVVPLCAYPIAGGDPSENTGTPGVWYKFVGTGHTVTASLCGGTTVDTQIAVFCLDCNTITCVGGNDDNGVGCAGVVSSVPVCTQLGSNYAVYVYAWSATVGYDFTLFLTDNGTNCSTTINCSPTGSCTLADGSCSVISLTACNAASGTWVPNGSCPATGACIAANGDCTIRNSANCAFNNGNYQGNGSACPGNGSCVSADGNCTQVNSFQCAFQNGTFGGVGNPCPPTGRCCQNGVCSIRNSANCQFIGGTYGGDGTNCSGRAGGTDFTNSTATAIPDAGTTQGTAQMTVASTLGVPVNYVVVKLNWSLAHTFIGDLIMKLTYNDGNTTQSVFLFRRVGRFSAAPEVVGTPFGYGTDFLTTGAYQFYDDAGGDIWTAAAPGTTLPVGDYRSSDNDGSATHPPNGAATNLSVFNGMGGSGTWTLDMSDWGGGDTGTVSSFTVNLNSTTTCPVAPPIGACCAANGGCQELTQANCTGTWQGGGTNCNPNNCPQLGACCINGINCTTGVLQANCTGTWSPGNSCDLVQGPPHGFCCPTNYNRDGAKDVGDIFYMIAKWFAHDPPADWDGNTLFEVGDIFGFIADWFVPC